MAKQNYLPEKGDSLFKLKPTGDVNADLAFLKSDKFEFVVAKAFKQAGDAIVRQFQDTHEWYREDELFMPAMYSYRHYVELILKWHLETARVWNLVTFAPDELAQHGLYPLWNKTKPVVKTVWPSLDPAVLSGVERLIQEMHTIDGTGQNMRYASDRKGNHSLAKVPETVSLDHLRDTMQKLYEFFEQLDDEWQSYFHQQGWEGLQSTMKNR